MALPPKRRGHSSNLPRSKTNGRPREKDEPRDERPTKRKGRNGTRRARSTSPTPDYPKRRRTLDPTLLARGMTARCLGSRVHLNPLTLEERERDLRHMEAYSSACTAYAQQFFIFQNRALVQSGHYGPVTAPTLVSTDHYVNGDGYSYDPYRPQRVMPIRIDPEEEKRISVLRKRIGTSEAQREVLETEYVSLMAHCVYECQRLRKTRYAADGHLKLLQELIKKRGRAVALRRVRCAVARDILKALRCRSVPQAQNSGPKRTDDEALDMLDVWNEIESTLREAEKACSSSDLPDEIRLLKSDRGQKYLRKAKDDKRKVTGKGDVDDEDDSVVPWGASPIPRTPYNLPVLLSYMSDVPDRGAGFGCSGVFGSNESSLCFFETNLPETFENMDAEEAEAQRLAEECDFLVKELEKERTSNNDLQRQIITKRKRYDEMCAMMVLLRGETEAVLMRHNILLDTPEARSAAQDIHKKEVEERQQRGEVMGAENVEDSDGENPPPRVQVEKREPMHPAEDENDGDDEGEVEEDEDEDGEILPPSEVVVKKAESGDSGPLNATSV